MFDRKLLKEKGKAAFKANYWMAVVASLILKAAAGGTTATSGSTTINSATDATEAQNIKELFNQLKQDPKLMTIIISVIAVVVIIVAVIQLLIDSFLINPIEMGSKSFFLKNADDPNTSFDEVKTGFTPSYKRNVKALFLRDIKVALWSLLLIVPGVMKSYAYAQVPYILAENPDMEPKEALDRSESMMIGHRMELFKLRLSFIGWDLLAVLTLGILDVFYVGPYSKATEAEFYKALKENA